MQFILPLSNGVDRSNDETRMAEGFARTITNAIYVPDDPDRLFKHPGRTSACTLASPLTTTPYGIRHLQFDNTSAVTGTPASQLLILANAAFYTQNEGTSLGGGVTSNPSTGWVSVKDKEGSPVAYARTGTFLKAVHDGLNRWIVWTGANERALLIDNDLNGRFLGLLQPEALTATTSTAAPVAVRPTSDAVATGTSVVDKTTLTFSSITDSAGTAHGFINPATTGNDGTNDASNAYDTDNATFAQVYRNSVGVTGSTFTFASASYSSQKIYVTLDGTAPNSGSTNKSNPNVTKAIGYVQVSVNGGTTFTTIWQAQLPVARTTISYGLADQGSAVTIVVRSFIRYISGTSKAELNIYDINRKSVGGNGAIDPGTYHYVTTEIYKTTLTTGETFVVESLPSREAAVTIADPNTTITAIVLNLPIQKNVDTMGITHDPANGFYLTRGVYRTTKTGAAPDYGQIAEVAIADTTFVDTFLVGATTLGAPPLNVAYAQADALYPPGTPPALWDATVSRAGVLFFIPLTRDRLQWCMPGQVDYLPLPAHDLALLPTDRNDKYSGVTSIGDAVLIFCRTRVYRLIDIPVVNQPNFDINRIQIDILSPIEGLAADPRGYCSFATQQGRAAVAWVSDNGIWMTDGTLVSERGMGIKKLSVNMNWTEDVNTSRLNETELIYDPILQMVLFDYFDNSGNRRSYYMHVHPDHWVETGQDSAVPKVTGPHTNQTVIGRTLGEVSTGGFRHWSLTATNVFNERTGTQDNGSNITSTIVTGWAYPSGPIEEFDIFYSGMYHNDWGSSQTCSLQIEARRDQTGLIQTVSKMGLSLQYARVTRSFQHLSGQSFRVTLTQTGTTVSPGSSPMLAFGPVVFDGESMGELERD